jgi:phytoene dehydrogenase-like protein
VNLRSAHDTVGIVKGGMGSITQAMARAAAEAGVTIRTGVEVARVDVRNGRAAGVVLADGAHVAADTVVSNADPKRTFLKLVPPADLPSAFREQIAALSTRAAYFKFHAALRELPDFSRYLGPGFDPRYLAQVKICPSAEAFVAAWQDAQAGRLPRAPLMEVQIPSVYDDSMAPPGHHVVSIWALWAPVRPAEGSWETRRQEMGERMIDLLTECFEDQGTSPAIPHSDHRALPVRRGDPSGRRGHGRAGAQRRPRHLEGPRAGRRGRRLIAGRPVSADQPVSPVRRRDRA